MERLAIFKCFGILGTSRPIKSKGNVVKISRSRLRKRLGWPRLMILSQPKGWTTNLFKFPLSWDKKLTTSNKQKMTSWQKTKRRLKIHPKLWCMSLRNDSISNCCTLPTAVSSSNSSTSPPPLSAFPSSYKTKIAIDPYHWPDRCRSCFPVR